MDLHSDVSGVLQNMTAPFFKTAECTSSDFKQTETLETLINKSSQNIKHRSIPAHCGL